MSMFDELRCDYPLPEGVSGEGREFQTKDYQDHPACDKLTLTKDGELLWSEWSGFDGNNDDRSVWTKPSKSDFTGSLRFYDFYAPGYKDPASAEFRWIHAKGWVEFEGVFEGGDLKELRVIEVRKE